MSNEPNRIMDELAKLMTDAAGAVCSMRDEVETAFRFQAECALKKLDLIKREDFEVFKEMVAKARSENEALNKRVEALEKQLRDSKKAV
ncbi:MAG: putative membrane fusion protein [Candidatus Tokpelaia sp. JSC189]|nr:MAG: putative membrane fusion protein [Candidatus Tokpelaia sp. JSC189]